MCETWLEKGGESRIKSLLPESHNWEVIHASRTKRRGRASGGIMVGTKKGWKEKEDRVKLEKMSEGIGGVKIRWEENWLNIFTVYSEGMGKEMEELFRSIEERCSGEGIIIGGDFNTRIGELGHEGIEENILLRKSKDRTIGLGGKRFVDKIYENGWHILNGRIQGDWDGEFTYVGARSCSVIDYIIVNDIVLDKIVEFKVEELVDSDHLPIRISLKELRQRTRSQSEDEAESNQEEEEQMKQTACWDEEAREIYRDNTDEQRNQ
ncbi:hypothetical protein X777_06702 [Ooceraea biroi]|uniref:Endonuclease/exonuclease/phosphatase domain-containing protein n=1 Tax=Ooceraea biroi TaxID=2015173 RepID=A0A026WD00_OOCBI|nr:hypothetical protein X777_06702 [Ooceraea biroi]